jgi:hypothetical protein
MLHDAQEHRRRRWGKVFRIRAIGDLFDITSSQDLGQKPLRTSEVLTWGSVPLNPLIRPSW